MKKGVLGLVNHSTISLRPYLLPLCVLLALCAAPFLPGYMILAFFVCAIELLLMVILPPERGLHVLLSALMFDGMIKVLSGFHPVVHVWQDVLMISLFLRMRMAGFSSAPGWPLFVILGAWVFIQVFNPFSLGPLPSLAGAKVYLSMALLYFVAWRLLDPDSARRTIGWLVLLGLLQACVAIIEDHWFQGELGRHVPLYLKLSKGGFLDDLFRPSGTTSGPGGPSIWMYLTMPLACFVISERRYTLPFRVAGAALLGLGTVTLFLCQTRLSMVLAFSTCGFFFLNPRVSLTTFSRRTVVAALVASFAFLAFVSWDRGTWVHLAAPWVGGEERASYLFERSSTVASVDKMGAWRLGAWGQMAILGDRTLTGIGLSRVGSAAGPWREQIRKDREFGPRWSFADNAYRMVFTELGLPGLVVWGLLLLSLALAIFSNGILRALPIDRAALCWLGFSAPLIWTFLGGLATEGMLFAPNSSLVWLMLGIGMRASR